MKHFALGKYKPSYCPKHIVIVILFEYFRLLYSWCWYGHISNFIHFGKCLENEWKLINNKRCLVCILLILLRKKLQYATKNILTWISWSWICRWYLMNGFSFRWFCSAIWNSCNPRWFFSAIRYNSCRIFLFQYFLEYFAISFFIFSTFVILYIKANFLICMFNCVWPKAGQILFMTSPLNKVCLQKKITYNETFAY